MKRFWFILMLAAAGLWLIGCQEKLPVELVGNQPENAIQVDLLKEIDPSLILDSSVDSTGLLQQDEQLYPATLVVSGIKYDVSGERKQFTYSRILINDKRSPIQNDSGKVVGYIGLNVGKAKLNTLSLQRDTRPYITLTTVNESLNAGSRYRLVELQERSQLNFSFIAGQQYTFDADGGRGVSPFQVSVQSPDEITITAPKSQSIILRDEDLDVQWEGAVGKTFRLVVSSYDPSTIVPVQPLINIQVNRNDHSVTIPSKVLKALPRTGSGRYLFSFVSSNSQEIQIPGYSENALVQASSIHNLVLWVR